MADPVSWFLIEPGWKVVASDGTEVGRIDEVVGDTGQDIFNGLSISTGLLGRPQYVPAEQVAEITEGRVDLTLSKEAVERLGEYEEPPTSAVIEPEAAGRLTRAEAAIEAPIHRHAEHESVWRRVASRLRARLRR